MTLLREEEDARARARGGWQRARQVAGASRERTAQSVQGAAEGVGDAGTQGGEGSVCLTTFGLDSAVEGATGHPEHVCEILLAQGLLQARGSSGRDGWNGSLSSRGGSVPEAPGALGPRWVRWGCEERQWTVRPGERAPVPRARERQCAGWQAGAVQPRGRPSWGPPPPTGLSGHPAPSSPVSPPGAPGVDAERVCRPVTFLPPRTAPGAE